MTYNIMEDDDEEELKMDLSKSKASQKSVTPAAPAKAPAVKLAATPEEPEDEED